MGGGEILVQKRTGVLAVNFRGLKRSFVTSLGLQPLKDAGGSFCGAVILNVLL